nr:proteasome subunit alpha [Halopiger djelfimassiliensis]
MTGTDRTIGAGPSTVPSSESGGAFHEHGGQTVPAERSTGITTGTTTVGLVGRDGVALAADRRASLGGRFVTNRSARKIEPVADRIAVAFSGSVGDAQSFVRQLRADLRAYELRHDGPVSVRTAATVAGALVRRGPFQALDLVLGGVDDTPAVYQVGGGGGVMETRYAASGSGMQLAYGTLEDTYEPDLSVTALRSVAATAVRNATERDTASGDGMTVGTITGDGLEIEAFDGIATALEATSDTDGKTDPRSVAGETGEEER